MKKLRDFFCFAFLLAVAQASAFGASAAEGEWREARSKNFHLVGNASEAQIRATALRLEQFRAACGRIFKDLNFNSPIPNRVVVFRDENAYRPFKPLHAGGATKDFVAGYFQPGEDVNYITLAADGDPENVFEVVFHEYFHFLVANNFGDSRLPPWLNEGLAAYYQTLRVEDHQRIVVGAPDKEYSALLKQRRLIDFEVFLETDYYTLHAQGDDRIGLFYAQAWAFVHFLMREAEGARRPQVEKFLELLKADKNARQAFAEAFRADYATVEKEFADYAARGVFQPEVVVMQDRFAYDSEVLSRSLSGAEADAYLGDLLYHADRLEEAAALLEKSLAANPNLSMALASLGLVRLKQENFAEAEKYLERAVAADDRNYLAHFNYAYVLSREGMTEHGFVSGYARESAERMRAALKKAIELNPDFAESYSLYAFVSVVRNEELEEATRMLEKALRIAPGNQWYLIRSAELYLRLENFHEARRIAQSVYQSAGDESLRLYAKNTVELINSTEAQMENVRREKKLWYADTISEEPFSEEEIARRREKALLESLNQIVRRPKINERRILGRLTRIECGADEIIYHVRVESETVKLRSRSLDSVVLTAYAAEKSARRIGCGALERESLAVINFRQTNEPRARVLGEAVSIEFVPENFRFLN